MAKTGGLSLVLHLIRLRSTNYDVIFILKACISRDFVLI